MVLKFMLDIVCTTLLNCLIIRFSTFEMGHVIKWLTCSIWKLYADLQKKFKGWTDKEWDGQIGRNKYLIYTIIFYKEWSRLLLGLLRWCLFSFKLLRLFVTFCSFSEQVEYEFLCKQVSRAAKFIPHFARGTQALEFGEVLRTNVVPVFALVDRNLAHVQANGAL